MERMVMINTMVLVLFRFLRDISLKNLEERQNGKHFDHVHPNSEMFGTPYPGVQNLLHPTPNSNFTENDISSVYMYCDD